MKKLLLTAGVIAPLTLAGVAYAAIKPSDYAQDVTAGQNQLNSDRNAKTQANEVKNGENVEGQADDRQEQVEKTIGDQESTMDDKEGGEASHGEAGSGSSDQATGTTQTNGGN